MLVSYQSQPTAPTLSAAPTKTPAITQDTVQQDSSQNFQQPIYHPQNSSRDESVQSYSINSMQLPNLREKQQPNTRNTNDALLVTDNYRDEGALRQSQSHVPSDFHTSERLQNRQVQSADISQYENQRQDNRTMGPVNDHNAHHSNGYDDVSHFKQNMPDATQGRHTSNMLLRILTIEYI